MNKDEGYSNTDQTLILWMRSLPPELHAALVQLLRGTAIPSPGLLSTLGDEIEELFEVVGFVGHNQQRLIV